MKDVARAAGVSQSTVSRALTPSSRGVVISEETVRRVLATVKELGYHPNQYARTLRGKKSHMVAMMIADISNPFYHPMVRAVQDVAFQHRYDVMIANSDHARDKEVLFIESVVRRPVDGVIIIPYHLDDDDLDDLIVRTGVAVAAVGNHIQHPQVDVAFADDARASHDLVTWLIRERGHERIAMICADLQFPVTIRRLDAFRRAMSEAGLDAPPEYVIEGDWSVETGQRAIRELMALPSPPTAVFAASDTIAIGALEAAEEAGLRVPDDIAIVGFDDIPEAQWVRPKLTTVAQHPGDMGRLLATALFHRIEREAGADLERRVYEVACQFVERESA
jgi:DNA-binding LacI/PurR family transcriptional regulator